MCFSAEESFLNMELDEKESAKHWKQHFFSLRKSLSAERRVSATLEDPNIELRERFRLMRQKNQVNMPDFYLAQFFFCFCSNNEFVLESRTSLLFTLSSISLLNEL